jgi:hypothetical protein
MLRQEAIKSMSYFHGVVEFESANRHFFWNRPFENLATEVVIPYINGNAVVVRRGGLSRLLNMKGATTLTVYETPHRLSRTLDGGAPTDFKEASFDQYECTRGFLERLRTMNVSSGESLLERTVAKTKPRAFVIMKFGDAVLDAAYEEVMRPVSREFGLSTLRVDEIEDAGKITDQILDEIAASRIVIADLSGERPNCYYEVGYAQALGREVVLCIRKHEKKHFDLSGYRFIEWETESELRTKLRSRLKSLLTTDS